MKKRGLLILVAVIAALALCATPVFAAPSEPYPDPHADGVVYIPRWGDTLAEISCWSGVTVDELIEVNGIADPDLVRAGVGIYVPAVLGCGEECRPVWSGIWCTDLPNGYHRFPDGKGGIHYGVAVRVPAAFCGDGGCATSGLSRCTFIKAWGPTPATADTAAAP